MASIQAIALWFSIQCSKRDKHNFRVTFTMFLFNFMCFVYSFNYVSYFHFIVFYLFTFYLVFIFPLDVPLALISVKHIELPLCMTCAIEVTLPVGASVRTCRISLL